MRRRGRRCTKGHCIPPSLYPLPPPKKKSLKQLTPRNPYRNLFIHLLLQPPSKGGHPAPPSCLPQDIITMPHSHLLALRRVWLCFWRQIKSCLASSRSPVLQRPDQLGAVPCTGCSASISSLYYAAVLLQLWSDKCQTKGQDPFP